VRKIEWTPDGIDSLNEILEYYLDKAGKNVSEAIYYKIIKEVEVLKSDKIRMKRTQELTDIGIYDVYELVIKPWKVYYKISGDNKKAYVMFVLDGRRNLEELLLSKVIDSQI
jgi:plasmid stabilization system protein ParE